MPTVWLDITMLDTPSMEVFETLQHLKSIDHDDFLILDSTMFE
jgi:hypothetical protein